MSDATPILLVPGLGCSPRLFGPQLPSLWQFGPVTVADTRRADSMAAIARQILEAAPPRFALAGLSMGGYISFEIMRQAPERVLRLALLDTAPRADRPDQTERRNAQIAMVREGRFSEVPALLFPLMVHPEHQQDEQLRRTFDEMFLENGADAFIRQQEAIKSRPDSRPSLAAIGCPTLVLVGDSDQVTPPDAAREIADGIRGARLVIVPKSGHLSTLEQPDAVTLALTEWMAA
jgi:pimeloyl-ACP methyl ester carboxylesterase